VVEKEIIVAHAFRCKNCGRIEHAEHAGENDVPHACTVCGKGVTFTADADLAEQARKDKKQVIEPMPGYFKIIDTENWEVLADAKPDRLKQLGIEPKHVVKHNGKKFKASTDNKMVEAHAEEKVGAKDKPGA
jgi:hypothetical protein